MRTALQIPALLAKMLYRLLGGQTITSVIREVGLQVSLLWSWLSGMTVYQIVLVKPSTYDKETHYVVRYRWASIPSNTLATLNGLIRDVHENQRLGANVRIVVRAYDDLVQSVRPKLLTFLMKLVPSRRLAMLVGAQTCQFARASDLAQAFTDHGVSTIVGGFHVSGVLAQFPDNGDPLNGRARRELGMLTLLERGVSLFAGELESSDGQEPSQRCTALLADGLRGQLRPVYDYLKDLPVLTDAPMPQLIPGLRRHFLRGHLATIDPSRGCPYDCSYCVIWTLQGRNVRDRGVDGVIAAIRANWQQYGVCRYFFTSDNLSKSAWKELFEALIRLRRDESIPVEFVMQADTKSPMGGFVELAAAAGCIHAFIGLESLNEDNLRAVDKLQNKPREYQALVDTYRRNTITVQFGFMIGLPHDSPESIRQDVERLKELGPDVVSFFVVTPLPGSVDHKRLYLAGVPMDADLNRYDSFGTVNEHPNMSRQAWEAAYLGAWDSFYSVENCVRILRRTPPTRYLGVFQQLVLAKYSMGITGHHPMISGLVPFRQRTARRPSAPRLNWFAFQADELRCRVRYWQKMFHLFQEVVEIWLQSRTRGEREQRIVDRLSEVHAGVWLAVKRQDLREAYHALGEKVPSALHLDLQLHLLRPTRADLAAYWESVTQQLKRGKFWVLLKWQYVRAVHAELFVLTSFLRAYLFRGT